MPADMCVETGGEHGGPEDRPAGAAVVGSASWSRRALPLIVAAVVLAVVLRVVALDSDPYARLSWSSGLLTDEGFYIHNARNVALFGHARMDDFNNMLIMPTLHYVQVAMFRICGAGAVQARVISVVCSLIAVAVLYCAVRRAFGSKVALIAGVILALDHTNLLYNRMALMDTPGEMLLVCALYCWVRGTGEAARPGWMVACGMLIAIAAITRSLAGIVLPAAILALAWSAIAARSAAQQIGSSGAHGTISPSDRSGTPDPIATVGTVDGPAGEAAAAHGPHAQTSQRARSFLRGALAIAAGLAVVGAVYYQTWYGFAGWRIEAMSRYYLWHQLLPNSPGRLALNAFNAWFGDERGAAPFLMRHTPIQLLLAAGWLFWRQSDSRGREVGPSEVIGGTQDSTVLFVISWLGWAALFLMIASYAPSRYYLMFYPPLAIAAALGFANFGSVVRTVLVSKAATFAVGSYCAYHAALLAWHHASLPALFAVASATAVGGAAALLACAAFHADRRRLVGLLRAAPAAVPVCWAVINGFYYVDWLAHLRYREQEASRQLAAGLPANAVVLGDVGPGLCLYNRLQVVPVIPGLCNDAEPVERYWGRPRFVAVLAEPYREQWWDRSYAGILIPANRITYFPSITRFPVAVYRVPPDFGAHAWITVF